MARPVALLLTLLTGFSGLVYEVAWQKYLGILLGSHSEAVSAVLAIFLGGLAAGYALFGRLTRGIALRARARREAPRLLGFYGAVESCIGLYALLFPFSFSAAQALSVRIPHVGEGWAFAIDVLLTVLLIAPPTVLMGGTIPVLTQALSERVEEATRVHARIYAMNTAGAFLGALAGAFVLIPSLGLDGVMYAMGAINLAAGVIFLALQRSARAPADEPQRADARAPARFTGYAAVALLGGFAMMCIQVVLNRIGALSLGSSHYTFAMIVAVFVLCIAVGAFCVSALRNIPPALIAGSQWLLVASLVWLYFQLDTAPYFAHVVRSLFISIPQSLILYYLTIFAGILVVLALPIGLAGALLPLVFHHLRGEMGELGGVAGKLYAWNTTGSLLGALLGGYALLFFVDLQDVFAIALGALALAAGILSALVLRPPLLAPVLATAIALGACALLPDWDPQRMSSGLFRYRRALAGTFRGPAAFYDITNKGNPILFYDDDPTSTITVSGVDESRSLVTNGKSDGNLQVDYTTMALTGLLPALLSEDPSRAFVIGWGLGVTAGTLGALDDVEEVVVAEIAPAVLEAAPLFDSGNRNALQNPKINAIRSDAYRALLRSEGRYGVIASEPSNPWVVGVEMLFSEEFLRAARDRLAPGGVYAQWFHLYEIDESTLEIALRSYLKVFGDMTIWFTRGNDVLLLGFRDGSPTLDIDALRERFHRPTFRESFELAGIESWIELLAHEVVPLGAVPASDLRGPIHTVRHPILSDSATRAFFVGDTTAVPKMSSDRAIRGAEGNSLLRREIGPGDVDEQVLEQLARQTCQMAQVANCATLFAYWKVNHPDSERYAATLAEMKRSKLDTSMPNSGVKASHLSNSLLDMLVDLYRGNPLEESDRRNAVQNAIATSIQFDTYFHHAFPFDPAARQRAWSLCELRASPESCDAARRRVDR